MRFGGLQWQNIHINRSVGIVVKVGVQFHTHTETDTKVIS